MCDFFSPPKKKICSLSGISYARHISVVCTFNCPEHIGLGGLLSKFILKSEAVSRLTFNISFYIILLNRWQ